MAWNKIKTAMVVGVSVLLVLGLATAVVKKIITPVSANANPGEWIWAGDSSNLERVPKIFLLRPSTLPADYLPFDMMGDHRYLARGKTIKELIAAVWSQKNSNIKLVYLGELPAIKYDFIAADRADWPDALQSEINQRFHLVEQIENRDSNQVLVVRSVP